MKHTDWLNEVTQLGTSSQSALFQHIVVTLLKNLFMTLVQGPKNYLR